jgi:hydrogenase maturation protein HypF
VAHLREFRLPGGEAAIRQPRRSALGLLYELNGARAFEQTELAPVKDFAEADLAVIRQTLAKELMTPITSSAGHLFDAVASLAGLRQRATFEGQAAMELEFAIQPCVSESYSFEIKSTAPSIIDWKPMIEEILDDVHKGETANTISAKFHNALVEIIVSVARHVGQTRVVLSGGCFQNRYLTERSVQRLLEAGFHPYWHQRVPTNDGGIALGQVYDAARRGTPEPKTTKVETKSKTKIFA